MSKLKSIKIKGKEYVEVNERIKAFREIHPNGAIITEMLSNENGICVFKATAFIDNNIVATGHAFESQTSSPVNKTSYIENCETSAVGRCMGILGIGIDTSIASAEEVDNAISQQDIDALKLKLRDAHEDGRLKEAFFTLSATEKEHLRDFANGLRAS